MNKNITLISNHNLYNQFAHFINEQDFDYIHNYWFIKPRMSNI